MKTIVLLGAMALTSYAADSSKSAPAQTSNRTQTYVNVNPKIYPPEAFAKKADRVQAFPAANPESVPNKEIRDAIFAKVPGLEKHISSFDELDKDLLLIRAKNFSLAKLKSAYPKIPNEPLEQLQFAAKKPVEKTSEPSQ